MMYFEDARLEFFGVPLAYMPYFSAPDPTVKRKTGFLMPTFGIELASTASRVTIPYYWALAPNYDVTLTPTITTQAGPAAAGRMAPAADQRLLHDPRRRHLPARQERLPRRRRRCPAIAISAAASRSSGQFRLTDKWVWGWDGTLLTDKTLLPGLRPLSERPEPPDLLTIDAGLRALAALPRRAAATAATSTCARSTSTASPRPTISSADSDHPSGHRSRLHGRAAGASAASSASHSNLTSLTRERADFDPIIADARRPAACARSPAPTRRVKTSTTACCAAFPGTYTRFSTEATWRRTIIDPYGQMFTPFVSVRGDVADCRDSATSRASPTSSRPATPTSRASCRPSASNTAIPFINVQSWGTQTIEPIAQIIVRPNETAHRHSCPTKTRRA